MKNGSSRLAFLRFITKRHGRNVHLICVQDVLPLKMLAVITVLLSQLFFFLSLFFLYVKQDFKGLANLQLPRRPERGKLLQLIITMVPLWHFSSDQPTENSVHLTKRWIFMQSLAISFFFFFSFLKQKENLKKLQLVLLLPADR